MTFLIPLAIALIAAYIQYQSREEMVTIFSAIVGVIGLLVSIVLAPWVIQLVLLVTGLAGMRYFCYRHSCNNALDAQRKQ